jgi:hypothetical protein
MTMPRLSLYRPEKSQDYKFFDRTVYEMFQVGGVDLYIHKYIGTEDADGVKKSATQIQDLLFLENRDRKYDQDIFTIRGHYQTQDIDFNLSQFGLFLSNDTLFVTIHINNSVDTLGRKIMPGDVIELPNLKDEYAANDYSQALKRFYVVEEVNRAAEGFSATWYPHLYRVKLKSIVDSQEYKDILDRPADESTYAGEWNPNTNYYPGQTVKYKGILYEVTQEVVGNTDVTETTIEPTVTDDWATYYTLSGDDTLRDLMSTYEKEITISNAVISEAEADAPKSGYDTSTFYTVAVDTESGDVNLTLVNSSIEATTDTLTNDTPLPLRNGYSGYLLDDGIATNGPLPGDAQFGFGIQFPIAPALGDMFLRTDFLPNRLFKFDGRRWIKQEDAMRMTMTNSDTRQTQKTSFINNTAKSGIRQLASDTIKIDLTGDEIWEAGSFTVNFTMSLTSATILTNINYDADYLVEVWLNETSKAVDVAFTNVAGKINIVINHSIYDGTAIRYTVYDRVVTQRQSLSKALRPQADN